ncbi:MAG: ABC transporter ATP-binding protein [Streptosporangiales bacterium]|nr:ABC transporter ATP-binding protein [Streptosporangiales bacterium]
MSADTTDRQPVLDIRGLCVDYGYGDAATHAVIEADLTLHRGEVVGLAGESGSGKSTIAYGATRLLRQPGVVTDGIVRFTPDAGKPDETIDILEASPQQLRAIRWSDIALVFQAAMNSLNPVMSVQAQLIDTLAAHGRGASRRERIDRAGELLELVGISQDRLKSFPHELSGGMKQRVMIALALALEPQVVIMDEPTTALDVVTQRQIMEQIMGLRDRLGFSVLFITHDLSLLLEMADTIAIMYAGRIVETAPARQLFHAPRHPYTAALLDSFPSLHGERTVMTGIPGSPPDMRKPPAGCAFADRCKFALDRCTADQPVLSSPAIKADGRRQVACWLHEENELPEPLAAPEPAVQAAGAAPEGGSK